MATETGSKQCKRCGKVMKITDFYKSNNLEAHPDGHVDLCKQCFVAHLDNWDSNTYIPLLEDLDIPYVPAEWNKLLQKWGSQPEKMTPTTILGKYAAKMRINQFKKYRFADSENLQAVAEKQAREALQKEGLSESEIDETIAAATPQPPPRPVTEPVAPTDPLEVSDVGFELTDEDITYLKLKWGNTYRPFEWVQLERLYQDMMKSYDIQAAGHKDTLKLVCKASLKANQLFDLGDIDGALKMTKAYDSLMKNGKFNLWTMKYFTCYHRG